MFIHQVKRGSEKRVHLSVNASHSHHCRVDGVRRTFAAKPHRSRPMEVVRVHRSSQWLMPTQHRPRPINALIMNFSSSTPSHNPHLPLQPLHKYMSKHPFTSLQLTIHICIINKHLSSNLTKHRSLHYLPLQQAQSQSCSHKNLITISLCVQKVQAVHACCSRSRSLSRPIDISSSSSQHKPK